MTLVLVGMLALAAAVALLLQRTPGDAVTIASIYAFALFVIPSRYVIGPLGGIATPAVLVGLGALLLWVLRRLHSPVSWIDTAPNPVRTAVLVMTSFALLSAGIARLRTLDELEAGGSGRTLVLLLAGVGVCLLLTDGTRSHARLERFVDRLIIFGSIAAVYGLVQFATSFDIGTVFAVEPLLEQAKSDAEFGRSIFTRPAGPALHPIAFAVVMSALLPLALHRLFYRPDRPLVSRVLPLLLIGAAVPTSLSRSAFLATLVGVGVLFLSWSTDRKLTALLYGGAALASTVFVPGLAGTLRNLFLGVTDDPSIQGRVDDVPYVVDLVERSPLVGRGFGTYTADGYRLLDNEFYASLIEVGVVGVVVYVGVLGVILYAAAAPRRRGAPEQVTHLGQALMGTSLAIVSSVFTFDTFFYRTTTGLLLLSFGMIGAVWRLGKVTQRHPSTPVNDRTDARSTP